MYVIVKPTEECNLACLFQLGRVAQVIFEDHSPYILMEPYNPVMKIHKYGHKVNHFGTWPKGLSWIQGDGDNKKKQKRKDERAEAGVDMVMVQIEDCLVWPIRVTEGEEGAWAASESCRISYDAFDYLRQFCEINLAVPSACLAKAGQEYYWQVHGKDP